MTPEELFDKIQPGQKWRLFYQTGNRNNRLIHIRGKVDDMIIYRYWARFRWVYVMESIWFFVAHMQGSHLTMLAPDAATPSSAGETS